MEIFLWIFILIIILHLFLKGFDWRGLERSHVPGYRVPRRTSVRNDLLPIFHHFDPFRQLHPPQRLLGYCRRQFGERPGEFSNVAKDLTILKR